MSKVNQGTYRCAWGTTCYKWVAQKKSQEKRQIIRVNKRKDNERKDN